MNASWSWPAERMDEATAAVARARRWESGQSSGIETEAVTLRYAEIESEERWQAIAATEVCRRWWGHMRDMMPCNPDDSPVAGDLREVFHLERRG